MLLMNVMKQCVFRSVKVPQNFGSGNCSVLRHCVLRLNLWELCCWWWCSGSLLFPVLSAWASTALQKPMLPLSVAFASGRGLTLWPRAARLVIGSNIHVLASIASVLGYWDLHPGLWLSLGPKSQGAFLPTHPDTLVAAVSGIVAQSTSLAQKSAGNQSAGIWHFLFLPKGALSWLGSHRPL